MIKEKFPEIKKLTKREKLILAGELWDEVVNEEQIDLTPEQKKELDRRIKHTEKYPESLIPWDQVKKELLKKYDG